MVAESCVYRLLTAIGVEGATTVTDIGIGADLRNSCIRRARGISNSDRHAICSRVLEARARSRRVRTGERDAGR